MLIDADCHISSSKFNNVAITADELIAKMDRDGVDKALVWIAPPYTRDIEPENKALYEATRRYPDRLLGFGWANPHLGHQRTLDDIHRCFEEYGFLGIKFNGAQDDYVIDDPELALPYIEEAARFGKPIAFHIGADFYENTHPIRMGRIAARYPNIPMLMVHMGGAALPSLDRSAVEVAAEHPNITLIGSAVSPKSILRAIQVLGPDRVAYGSDTPFQLLHVELAKYRALLRDLPADAQVRVMGGTIARVLGVAGN
ncbi:MAG: amidohydrolase family protein [Chloroflexi bacterium]|nr:amidohydrolase family protein [Chloroflexota bacterium]